MQSIRSKVEVLSTEEIVRIHESSLRLLERVGMKVPHAEVCRLAKERGALVDESDFTVRLPAAMMRELLDEVRRAPGEAGHTGDTLRTITGNVSTQVFFVEDGTGERRYGTLEDLRNGIALLQGLPNFPRANAVVVPSDVPGALSDVMSYREIYKYSRKPGGTYILTPGSARYVIEMSRVMGREVSYLFDTISPLSFARNSLEIALLFREQALQLTMTPMVMAGSTGPISLAGLLTLQNAEVLGSLFFIHVLTGRVPRYIASGHTNDARHNMFCSFGSPNQALIGAASAQMAAFYGLESGTNSGLTDAITPDFQCGFEKALSACFSVLAGNGAIGGQGIVGADQGMSFSQLVLDNEWLDALRYVTRGIEVNEETLALDVIEEVGAGGNFLGEEHTVCYMRESGWETSLFARDGFEALTAGGHDLRAAAAARARALIAQNRTDEPVVPEETARELDRIAERALSELT